MKNFRFISICKKFYFCVVALFILNACNKEDVTTNEVAVSSKIDAKATSLGVNDIKVIDGVLKFESTEHFREVFNELKVDKNYLAKISMIIGFKSLQVQIAKLTDKDFQKIASENSLSTYENLLCIEEEGDGNKNIVPMTENDLLRNLLNYNASIQIGDTLVRYTADRIYFASVKEKNDIFTIKQSAEELSKSKIRFEKRLKIKKASKIKSARQTNSEIDIRYTFDGTLQRFKGVIVSEHNFWGNSAYVKIDHDRYYHGWFGSTWWSGSGAQYMKLEGNGNLWQLPYYFPYTLNISLENYDSSEIGGGDLGNIEWRYFNAHGTCRGRNGVTYHLFWSW